MRSSDLLWRAAAAELLLPEDLELDAMFGDSVADALPEPCMQRPPIGLSLRKSESFVDLINRHLAAAQPAAGTGC
jgi:hypothetical protein